VLTIASRFIAACWIVFFVVWFVAAWFAKRTVDRAATWTRRSIVWIVVILVIGTGTRWWPLANRVVLWHATAGLAAVAGAITAAGLSLALWARATLGGNWSGVIVLKEQHELIDRGPYAFVRHPIYTGVLLMVFGTVTFLGTTDGAIMFTTVVVGLAVEAQREERWLTRHFADAYPRYCARVRARLIPFVL